jgi:hypothetical protein
MSQTDNWPQAPILAGLPAVAQLEPRFDAERLRSDTEVLLRERWAQPRIVSGDGVGGYVTNLEWRTLSMRSIGGDEERTDAGGPGLAEYANTPLLAKAPYIAEVMDAIPAPLRAVRLMSLGPGAESPYHHDTKYGFPWGTLRLHVPLITTPGAVLLIDGGSHRWEPGALWYADFSRMHMVRNTDNITRVHLVIDCHVTPQLLELFPAAFQTPAVRRNALLAAPEVAPEVAVDPAAAQAVRCEFAMPASFGSFEEADGQFAQDQQTITARIDLVGDQFVLLLDGKSAYQLIPLGNGEFRFAGWTVERTIAVAPTHLGPAVTLRARVGAVTRALELPAELPR